MISIASRKDMLLADQLSQDNNPKVLSAAAQRALKEAQERREKNDALTLPTEVGGRGGAEPVRFGDYEIKGRAIDF
jgi:hypothetical protein